MTSKKLTRRTFLKGTVAGTALLGATGCGTFNIFPRHVLGGPRFRSPNEKLNIACVGCGGQANTDIAGMMQENIVALCDVDEVRAAEVFKQFPNVPKFTDYRKMLDKLDNQIDAVTVTTPDHMHYPVAMHAMQMNKHVFVQKPMAHTILEAREMTNYARRHGLMTQMGIQGHGKEDIRLMVEWIRAGALGDVHEVVYWTDRPIWPQAIHRPAESEPIPDTLDWNMWLGPAKYREYNSAYLPFNWRGWWDFGTGALGDMACHMMDAAFWALELGSPTSVEAESGPMTKESPPEWSIITYQFPARGSKPPVKVVWYDGKKMPPRPEGFEEDRKMLENGQFIIGDKAVMMAGPNCDSPRLVPETKMKEFLPNRPPESIPRLPGTHYEEWIASCKGAPKPLGNFDYSGPLTEMVLLGNLAVRTGEKIEWDGVNMRCTNVPEANNYVTKEYRKF